MRLATLRRRATPSGVAAVVPASGPARIDRRTKNLTKRLRPGDVAVIDHADLDRPSAEALVACGVSAVVNAATSISGRYPNRGPEVLLAAGVPLLDGVGTGLLERLREGEPVRLDGDRLFAGERLVAVGVRQNVDLVAEATEKARAGLSAQLEAFAANTLDYLRRERDLLFDDIAVPPLRTQISGRHVLLVVRGEGTKHDLASLRPYIREYRPVLIGVDGGADILREEGYRPELIVGDMDSVADETLSGGAEIVVHAYADGRAPGLERVESLGLSGAVFPVGGTSEDAAMLLADEMGASVIVAVGAHATLIEFLDKGRQGMASTFLTRLRVGGKLVDAKGVSRLYRSRIPTSSLLLLILATFITFTAAVAVSGAGRLYVTLLEDKWHSVWLWLNQLVT